MTELGMAMGGYRKEDEFCDHTLRALAEHFGASGDVRTQVVCVDRRRQWRNAKNIWHSAGIRSGMYAAGAPFRCRPRRSATGGS